MRQFGLVLLLCAALPFSVLRAYAGDGPVTPGEAIRLFNGKDLSNFYTWLVDDKYQDPDKVFSVVDQMDGAPAIRVSGRRWGAFITKEAYANYHLIAEFRWGLL